VRTEKQKAAEKKYRNSAKGKANARAWYLANKERTRKAAQKRSAE
jgi:hypothetical protein